MRIYVHTMGLWCGLRMPWLLKELGLLEGAAVDDEDDGAENERGDDEDMGFGDRPHPGALMVNRVAASTGRRTRAAPTVAMSMSATSSSGPAPA